MFSQPSTINRKLQSHNWPLISTAPKVPSSQIVTKLVKKGLVIRQNHETNKKTILLLPTQEGKRLSRAHKKYDAADEAETLEILLQNCTMDEIRSFHKVLQCYNKLFQEEPDNP